MVSMSLLEYLLMYDRFGVHGTQQSSWQEVCFDSREYGRHQSKGNILLNLFDRQEQEGLLNQK